MRQPNSIRGAATTAYVWIALVPLVALLGPTGAIAKQHGNCKLTDDVKNICARANAKCMKDGKSGRCEQRSGGCICNISGAKIRREYRRPIPGAELTPLPRPPATDLPTLTPGSETLAPQAPLPGTRLQKRPEAIQPRPPPAGTLPEPLGTTKLRPGIPILPSETEVPGETTLPRPGGLGPIQKPGVGQPSQGGPPAGDISR